MGEGLARETAWFVGPRDDRQTEVERLEHHPPLGVLRDGERDQRIGIVIGRPDVGEPARQAEPAPGAM
ncbi:MAG: hypothetical protein JO100_00110 [Pseudonocardia sp.]|nr:hypothetical protein [Pseudonocardia sp.]